MLEAPEWELSKQEAENYANAVKKLAAEYPMLQLSPKTLAWIEFSSVMVGIHSPRIMTTLARKSPAKAPGPVLQMPSTSKPLPGTPNPPAPAPVAAAPAQTAPPPSSQNGSGEAPSMSSVIRSLSNPSGLDSIPEA